MPVGNRSCTIECTVLAYVVRGVEKYVLVFLNSSEMDLGCFMC